MKKFSDLAVENIQLLSNGESALELQLMKIASTNKKITVSIDTFVEMLRIDIKSTFTTISDRAILMTGHYCTIYGMQIYVNKKIGLGEYLEENETIER